MEQNSADYMIIDQTTPNHTRNLIYLKKTLEFLLPTSIISFLLFYFSVLNFLLDPLHEFYSSITPIFTDRKCMMFLICNGILAFLANNLKLNNGHSSKSSDEEDGRLLFRGNTDYVDDHTPVDDALHQEEKEIKINAQQQQPHVSEERDDTNQMVRLETEECEVEDDDDEDEEEAVEKIHQAVGEKSASVKEMRVSTEDLNKKFDEFIRKMKEEIRMEARQQYSILV